MGASEGKTHRASIAKTHHISMFLFCTRDTVVICLCLTPWNPLRLSRDDLAHHVCNL